MIIVVMLAMAILSISTAVWAGTNIRKAALNEERKGCDLLDGPFWAMMISLVVLAFASWYMF